MKRIVFFSLLAFFIWINTTQGSIKTSYYNLSDIERDGHLAVGKTAQMNLKIVAQNSRYEFVAEDSSGRQISLNFAKAKVSPEIVRRKEVSVGGVYSIIIQISDVKLGAEKIGISGNVLAIGFPNEINLRTEKKRPAEGGYVWDESQQRYVLKPEAEKKEVPQRAGEKPQGRGSWVWDESQQRYVLQVEPEKKEVSEKEKKAYEVIQEEKLKISEVQRVPVPQSALPEKPIKSEGKTIYRDPNHWDFKGNQFRVVDNILVGGGGQGIGSVWLEHSEEPVSVEFDYYSDNIDSEAILFIYGNGRDEKEGYSFTLNPNWSAIRKNSFKEFLAVSTDDNFRLKPNNWYKMKAVVTSDGTINFSVDRTAAHGNVLVASDKSYTGGAIGFMVWWQATGKRYIKNVKIERLLSRKVTTALTGRPLAEKKPSLIDKSRVVARASREERLNIPLITNPAGIVIFVSLVSAGLIAAGRLIV